MIKSFIFMFAIGRLAGVFIINKKEKNMCINVCRPFSQARPGQGLEWGGI
jgi:hypothetical protein